MPSISLSTVFTDIACLMTMSLTLNKKIRNGHFWQNRLHNSEYAQWTLKYHKDLVRNDRKSHIMVDICDRRSPTECMDSFYGKGILCWRNVFWSLQKYKPFNAKHAFLLCSSFSLHNKIFAIKRKKMTPLEKEFFQLKSRKANCYNVYICL